MLKYYLDNNNYEITFTTGKEVILHEDEIYELSYSEFKEDMSDIEEENTNMLHSIEEAMGTLRDALEYLDDLENLPQLKKNQDKFDEFIELIRSAVNETDDIIGQYI